MDHPSQLSGCWAKIDRATEHLNTLNAGVLGYLNTNPYRFTGELEAKRTQYVVRLRVDKQPPVRLAAIFGDLVQNLRSALDHLVYELVRLNERNPNRSKTAFPIYDAEPAEGFAAATIDSLLGIGDGPRALIEELQPYNRFEPGRQALGLIRRFSNQDKHRTLIGFGTGLRYPGDDLPVRLTVNKDIRITGDMTVQTGKVLKGGTKILWLPVEICGPNPKVQMHGELPLDIAFGVQPALRAEAIPPTCGEVIRIVRSFEPFFERLF